jgi:A/G-specific adenine glycosylase
VADAAVLSDVRALLLAWYAADHRDFPWRHTSDPYAVLVS